MDLKALAKSVIERLWLLRLDQVKEVCDCNKISLEDAPTQRVLIKRVTESIDAVIECEEEDVAKHFLLSMLTFMETQGEREDDENDGGSNKNATGISRAEKYTVNETDLQQSHLKLHTQNTEMRDKMVKIKGKEDEEQNRSLEQQPFTCLAPEVSEMTAKVLVKEQSSDIVRRKNRETPAVEERRETEFYEMVKLLREEVAELRKSQNNPPEHMARGRSSCRKGCRACQERGEEDRCEHCFRCGVVGHAAQGCRAPKNPAEGRSNPRNLNPQPVACGPRQCVKGDPKDTVPVPYHEPLKKSTHTVLQVQGPVSPGPERLLVNIFNGSDGMKVPVMVRSTDTIGKLQKKALQWKPELRAIPNLVYNGKPVQLHQTLLELQVKPGATFITYQKCHGS